MAEVKGWRGHALCWAMGGLSALAMPPTDFWFLFFFTIPFLIARLQRASNLARGFAQGWLFGFGYFCIALHWIGFAFLVDAATYLWMMPFAVGGLAAVMALYWGLAGLAGVAAARRGLPLFLTLPALLSITEWLRGHLMTGFPWAVPGLAFDGMGSFIQFAAVVGMTGLTFTILQWSAAAGALFAARRWQRVGALAMLLTAIPIWLWGHLRDQQDAGFVDGVTLQIVQPNIPQNDKWRFGNRDRIFERLLNMSLPMPGSNGAATLIIWPESAVPFLLAESESAKARLQRLLAPGQILITGAIRRDGTEDDANYFTSVLAFDNSGAVVATYDKWRLVPGGEFLPFEWILEPLGFKRLVELPGGFTAGTGPHTLAIPGAPDAGASICYEAIFPDRQIASGERPGWIVNVTNDGWFGRSTGPYQHFAQLRLRSLEQGLPAVRSANTGISGVIDAYGHVLQRTPLEEQTVIVVKLPRAISATVYATYGDLLMFVLAGCGILAALIVARKSQ